MGHSSTRKIWKPTPQNQFALSDVKVMHGGPVGMRLPEHEHTDIQLGIHFVSAGKAGRHRPASDTPSYFSLIPSGKPHSGGWRDDCEVVVTLISKLQVERAADEVLRSSAFEIVDTPCGVDPVILSMGTVLRREFLNGGIDPLFVEAVGTVLTGHLLRRWTSRPDQRPLKGRLSPDQLRIILEAIDVSMASGVRVAALAAQLGMGSHQFTRLFGQTLGTSPYRFVSLRRIERARLLLQTTSLSLVEIALELGFASQSHFTSAFRGEVRTTPAAYRLASRRSTVYSHASGSQLAQSGAS